MKKVIVLATLSGMSFLGAWLMARYELGDRMYKFESDVQGIGPARGGVAPDEEDVEGKVFDYADARGVELTEVWVSVAPLSRDNMGRSDAMTKMVQEKLDAAVDKGRENAPVIDSESSAVVEDYLDDRNLEIKGTLIEIEVHVRAEKWLWAEEEDFSTTITLR